MTKLLLWRSGREERLSSNSVIDSIFANPESQQNLQTFYTLVILVQYFT
jgi:hypothetical protein